jgi:hypothetical protein
MEVKKCFSIVDQRKLNEMKMFLAISFYLSKTTNVNYLCMVIYFRILVCYCENEDYRNN